MPNDNLALHGRLMVDPQALHRFRFEDGHPFVPLGFEWDWMMAYHQEHGEGSPSTRDNPSFGDALDLLRESGFNYVVGNLYAHEYHRNQATEETEPYLYRPPKIYIYGGTNERPDHFRPNVSFFQDCDRAIAALHRRGLLLHLMVQVQNKKVNWPDRASVQDDVFWHYVIARYQAYCNVVWDISKETYNLLHRTGSHAYALSRIQLIRQADVYQHLITSHDSEQESWGKASVVDEACDFLSDQVKFRGATDDWPLRSAQKLNLEAIRRWRNVGKPYVNVEYGYELGIEPLSAPNPKFCTSGENMLLWAWALYVGGAYPNYYYCNTSWDLLKFHPVPPSWQCYRYLVDFIDGMDFNRLTPDNDYVQRGMCSAEPGRQYFVLLPAGGDTWIDLTAVDRDHPILAVWMDIQTGQRESWTVEGWGFSVRLANPLEHVDHPCAIYVNVQ
jgi:hypothetical protein